MATPKKVNGRIWHQELARAYHSNTEIRMGSDTILRMLEQHPFPLRLAAINLGKILRASGDCVDALRNLEAIVGDHE